MANISVKDLKTAQDKQRTDEGGGKIHALLSFVFLVFGIILILKLSNLNIAFLGYLPDAVLYWTAAIGSTIGGLYMIYKKYFYRQRFVLR